MPLPVPKAAPVTATTAGAHGAVALKKPTLPLHRRITRSVTRPISNWLQKGECEDPLLAVYFDSLPHWQRLILAEKGLHYTRRDMIADFIYRSAGRIVGCFGICAIFIFLCALAERIAWRVYSILYPAEAKLLMQEKIVGFMDRVELID